MPGARPRRTVLELLGLIAAPGAFVVAYRRLGAHRQGQRLPELPRGSLWIVALAGGVAGLAPRGEPTGRIVVDVLWTAGAPAALAVLAAGARRWALVTTAVLTVAVVAIGANPTWAGSIGSGVALGVALALARRPAEATVVRAIVGIGLAVALTHLTWPRVTGASTAVATLVALPVIGSGLIAIGRPWRARVVWAAVAATLGLGLAVSGAAYAAFKARTGLEDGRDAANAAVDAVSAGDEKLAAERFEEAGRAFDDAARYLDAWWARAAGAVPVVAPNLDAVRTVNGQLVRLALDGAAVARAVDPSSISLRSGRVDLAALTAVEEPLATAAASIEDALVALRGLDSPWIVPPLADELAEAIDDLDEARVDAGDAVSAAQAVPGILGAYEHRSYFIALVTPSEMRATVGIIGGYAILDADDGRLQLVRAGTNAELNAGTVGTVGTVGSGGSAGTPGGAEPAPVAGPERTLEAPEDYLARYGTFSPETLWQNVTASPDFPTVAGVIANLYPQSGGDPIDGVIAIDPIGLSQLLRITGPVTVADWDVPITADNAQSVLLFDQYVRFADQADRKGFLGQVLAGVWQKLLVTDVAPEDFFRILKESVRAKHLMMTTFEPDEAALFGRIRADGAVPTRSGDTLGVFGFNDAGNKIDWFLSRSIAYELTFDPVTGDAVGRITVALTNQAPATGLPEYIIGELERDPSTWGTNIVWLSVYTELPVVATSITDPVTGTAGVWEITEEVELDRLVASGFLSIPPGQTVTVTLDMEGALPTGAYHLDVLGQATITPDRLRVNVVVPPALEPGSPSGGLVVSGSSALYEGDVGGDLSLGFEPTPRGSDDNESWWDSLRSGG